MKYVKWVCLGMLSIVVVAAGCNRSAAPSAETGNDPAPGASRHAPGEHMAHGKGPNGGVVFDLGAYHAEFVVDHDKNEASVFILTPEENKPASVAAQELTLTMKETKTKDGKASPRTTVQLRPQGAVGEKAFKFVGVDAALGNAVNFIGAIAGLIDGKPALGEFTITKHADIPEGVSGTPAERDLFLTPGGIYTPSDIQANGNTLPSQKFRDISWPHDDDLKPGDKVCPVTANKADSRCNWIVNGKKYEFCCTPCLDKFVKWAKQDPRKIKEPDSYIQK